MDCEPVDQSEIDQAAAEVKTKTDGVVQLGSLDAAGDHEILSQVSFPVPFPVFFRFHFRFYFRFYFRFTSGFVRTPGFYETLKSHFGEIESYPAIKIIYPDQSDATNLLKKVQDISDVTGGNIEIGDISSNIGDVIDTVVNDINPITPLNADNFGDTTGTSDPPTDNQPEDDIGCVLDIGCGVIVINADCDNRDECEKLKQTIIASNDEIKDVTDGKIKFCAVQPTDRIGFITHPK